jgi:hypothetical protein
MCKQTNRTSEIAPGSGLQQIYNSLILIIFIKKMFKSQEIGHIWLDNKLYSEGQGWDVIVGANLHLIEWIIWMQLSLLIKQRIGCGDECGISVPQNIRGQISNLSPKC